MATIVIIGLVIFVAGAAVGAVLLVSWGIQREERDFSLTRRAPGQVSQGARRVTGLCVRRRTDLPPPAGQPGRHARLAGQARPAGAAGTRPASQRGHPRRTISGAWCGADRCPGPRAGGHRPGSEMRAQRGVLRELTAASAGGVCGSGRSFWGAGGNLPTMSENLIPVGGVDADCHPDRPPVSA